MWPTHDIAADVYFSRKQRPPGGTVAVARQENVTMLTSRLGDDAHPQNQTRAIPN